MPKQRNHNLFQDLALHYAMGSTIAAWVRAHPQVSERTARGWKATPEFKNLVRQHHKAKADRVIGLHAALVVKATTKLASLLKGTENEALAFQIARDIRDTYLDMMHRDEFDRRLSALEEGRDGPSDPGRADQAEEPRGISQDDSGPVG
jgi:HD-like signal output (HDOD) protein